MKKKTETFNVDPEPGYSYEVSTFTCEEPDCKYETDDEEKAKTHRGAHVIRETRQLAGKYFYRFDSDEDLKARHDFEGSDDFRHEGVLEPEYAGPGWYYSASYKAPCRCGGCGNYDSRYEPATKFLKALNEDKARIEQNITDLTNLINPQ